MCKVVFFLISNNLTYHLLICFSTLNDKKIKYFQASPSMDVEGGVIGPWMSGTDRSPVGPEIFYQIWGIARPFYFRNKVRQFIFPAILCYEDSVRCRITLNKRSLSSILNQVSFINPVSVFYRFSAVFLRIFFRMIICINSLPDGTMCKFDKSLTTITPYIKT